MAQYEHLTSDKLCALLTDRDKTIQAQDNIIVALKSQIQAYKEKITGLQRQLTHVLHELPPNGDSDTGVKSPLAPLRASAVEKAPHETKIMDAEDENPVFVGDKINTTGLHGRAKPPRYSNSCRREAKG